MEGFIACFVVFTVIIVAAGIIGQVSCNNARRKKKEEKLALLDKFPHLAGQILQSIDDDDARHEARMIKMSENLNQAFNSSRREAPKPASQAGAKVASAVINGGIGVAKRLMK